MSGTQKFNNISKEGNIAICLLVKTVNPVSLQLLKDLGRPGYSLFVCPDSDPHRVNVKKEGNISVINVPNRRCKKAGFIGSVLTLRRRSCARDKALWFFWRRVKFNFVWFIEEDVLVPHRDTLYNLDHKLRTADFVCAPVRSYSEDRRWYHWGLRSSASLPWCHAMICACRMSRKMLNEIGNYARSRRSIVFDELLFPSLARGRLLKIRTPKELRRVVWRRNWKDTEVNGQYLYHPMKDIHRQKRLREKLRSGN